MIMCEKASNFSAEWERSHAYLGEILRIPYIWRTCATFTKQISIFNRRNSPMFHLGLNLSLGIMIEYSTYKRDKTLLVKLYKPS